MHLHSVLIGIVLPVFQFVKWQLTRIDSRFGSLCRILHAAAHTHLETSKQISQTGFLVLLVLPEPGINESRVQRNCLYIGVTGQSIGERD